MGSIQFVYCEVFNKYIVTIKFKALRLQRRHLIPSSGCLVKLGLTIIMHGRAYYHFKFQGLN